MAEITGRDIKGFNLRSGALKALRHAEDQLFRNHRQNLLFFALDILDHFHKDPHLAPLRKAVPEIFATFESLSPYLHDHDKREAMFHWERDTALKKMHEGLKAIAAMSGRAVDGLADASVLRGVNTVSAAAAAYMDMAETLHAGPAADDDNLYHTAHVTPYVSAAFMAEYLSMITRELASAGVPDDITHPVTALCSRIRNNLPHGRVLNRPLYENGEKDRATLYNIMAAMSTTADAVKTLQQRVDTKSENGRQLAARLNYVFQSFAPYDWEQYESKSPRSDPDAGSADILPLRARLG